MAGDIGFSISSRELEQLADRLREAGNGRRAQQRYQRAVAEVSRPIVPQLRAAVQNVRVTSSRGGMGRPDRSTNLRQRVASAIGVRGTRAGVRIHVDADQVDPQYGASLPRYLDGELQQWRRWRHPVFGHTDRWVSQTGSPWFFRTIRRHESRVRRAIARAMQDIAREIQG